MVVKKAIFGLLRRIEDDTARTEAVTLIQYLGIDYVEQLANQTRKGLESHEVTPGTIDALERVLVSEYDAGFAKDAVRDTVQVNIGEAYGVDCVVEAELIDEEELDVADDVPDVGNSVDEDSAKPSGLKPDNKYGGALDDFDEKTPVPAVFGTYQSEDDKARLQTGDDFNAPDSCLISQLLNIINT